MHLILLTFWQTVVMNLIEERIPKVDFFVILNIPVSFDSGCNGNQDRNALKS